MLRDDRQHVGVVEIPIMAGKEGFWHTDWVGWGGVGRGGATQRRYQHKGYLTGAKSQNRSFMPVVLLLNIIVTRGPPRTSLVVF